MTRRRDVSEEFRDGFQIREGVIGMPFEHPTIPRTSESVGLTLDVDLIAISKARQALPRDERRAYDLHFGLEDGNHHRTDEQCAGEMGIQVDEFRRLRDEAIRKLHN